MKIFDSRPGFDCGSLYLGIDNSQVSGVRVVCLRSGLANLDRPAWHRRIPNLAEFQTLMLHISPAVVQAATTGISHDQFGLLTWLTQRRIPVERLPPPYQVSRHTPLPRVYARAYALARALASRDQVPRISEHLLTVTAEFRDRLQLLERELLLLQAEAHLDVPF